MSYATIEDLGAAFSENELLRLSDRDGSGEQDDEVLNRALDEATRQINESLSPRYDLVLVVAANSERLRDCCADIARYRLYDNEHLPDDHPVRLRYMEWFKWLEKVRIGEITVGGLEDALLDEPTAAASKPVAPAKTLSYGAQFDSLYRRSLP